MCPPPSRLPLLPYRLSFSCSQTVEWHLTRTQIGIHMRSGLASDIHKQSKLPSSSSLSFSLPLSLSPHYSLSPLPHSLSTSFPVKWQFCLCNSASTLNRFTWDLHKLSASFEAEAAFGVRASSQGCFGSLMVYTLVPPPPSLHLACPAGCLPQMNLNLLCNKNCCRFSTVNVSIRQGVVLLLKSALWLPLPSPFPHALSIS